MLLDFAAFETKSEPTTALPYRRLSPGERLLREVRDIAGPLAELVDHRETAWASITFSGARHTIVLRFTGTEAASDGERLIAHLPDHEFRLRGTLVADASVVRVDHELAPAPLMEVECEILLLDED